VRRSDFGRASAAATLILLGLGTAPRVGAQAPAFEVATVKLSKSGSGVSGGCNGIDSRHTPGQAAAAPPLGRCVIHDARLSHLIYIAYELGSIQLLRRGPDWVAQGDDRFDIEAKAEDPGKTTDRELHDMLQALLAERFQLKFHWEPVEMPGFALKIGKNGPKFQPSRSEEAGISFAPTAEGKGVVNGKPILGQPTSMRARRSSMAVLASLLSQIGGRGPVVDGTGLQGVYDFRLAWDEEAGPSLATAVQEQLGLRLEPQKVPVSFFVIDSAQKPGAN
jgi:uncharacterized protein (TIGR03435 family)